MIVKYILLKFIFCVDGDVFFSFFIVLQQIKNLFEDKNPIGLKRRVQLNWQPWVQIPSPHSQVLS